MPMLAPNEARRAMSPLRPFTKLDCSESSENPPSRRTRPAPIVSGSSVTSGRCCACAVRAHAVTQTAKIIDFRFQILRIHHVVTLGHHRRRLSRSIVTGPSLISSTSMCAWNSPVSTLTFSARSASTSPSYSGFAAAGDSASSNDGRRPRRQSPHNVNCDTTSTAPPASRQRQVHLAGGILEDAEVAHLAGDVGDVVGAVALFDAGKHEQPAANLADRRARRRGRARRSHVGRRRAWFSRSGARSRCRHANLQQLGGVLLFDDFGRRDSAACRAGGAATRSTAPSASNSSRRRSRARGPSAAA